MTFQLTGYQADASDKVSSLLRYAADDFINRGAKLTAVGLAAPTGAGKTVIATDILERLLLGDGERAANRNLSILWVTDDPALNRQTRDKMQLASGRLADGDFIEMGEHGGSGYDAKRLERGKVHFAHIQLFGKGTTSMQPSNAREFGLWDIVANTIESYGSDFLLVIDEAHRGTGDGSRDSATILARLCHGGTADHFSGRGQPPAPVIFGISATPRRFKESMDRAGRTIEMCQVPVAAVRESGLLKDQIVVRHPGENQPSEATLLALAVAELKAFDAAWRAHTEHASIPPVEPLLVIQVAPGITDTQVAEIITTLETEWSPLKDEAVRHAFDSHTTLHLPAAGGRVEREVRYIAPDRIAADKRVRAVLFKNALTTGWDCPRAEVMLSLRSAKDYTNIAQLIGRMVRTPLAERIESDIPETESLNAVALYLPHYDRKAVAQVVAALGEDTGGEVEIVLDPIDCVPLAVQADGTPVPDAVWDLLAALPSKMRAKKAWRSETDRLLGLAQLLRNHDVLAGASAKARARIVGAIKTEVEVRREVIDKLVDDVVTLDMSQTVYDNRRGEILTANAAPTTPVAARFTDVDAQFATAVRAMPDAAAKWYWNALQDDDPQLDPYDAKAKVAAIAKTSEMTTAFKTAIENAAAGQIETWRTQYQNQVKRLPKSVEAKFAAAWTPDVGVVSVDIELPETVSAPTEKLTGIGDQATTKRIPTYAKHLYVAPDGHDKVAAGEFPANLTGWEVDVLALETAHGSLVAWYRNPARSKHGLAVSYRESEGGVGLLYPDFLFFHRASDGRVVVDVVDPHQHNQADTGPKWAGLARWAQENDDKVRRVMAVIKVGDELLGLDLTLDGIVEQLEACGGKSDIEALFTKRGGAY